MCVYVCVYVFMQMCSLFIHVPPSWAKGTNPPAHMCVCMCVCIYAKYVYVNMMYVFMQALKCGVMCEHVHFCMYVLLFLELSICGICIRMRDCVCADEGFDTNMPKLPEAIPMCVKECFGTHINKFLKPSERVR